MIAVRQEWPAALAERYRREGYWRGETLGQILRASAAAAPERLAVVAGAARWTYADLDRKADALAAGFLDAGLQPGDRVIVHLPNIAEFLSVVFGLLRAAILPLFALPAHRRSEIVHFARTAEAVGYIVADRHDGFDYRVLAAELVAAVRSVRFIGVAGEPGPFLPLDGIARDAPGRVPVEPDASDVAFLQLSGGSTGLSKLIPRTHDDYAYSIRASADICGLGPSSVYLGALPIAHNYPMSSPGFFGTLYAGGTVVLSPSPSPDRAFPLIERERVTITGVVPPIALIWLDAAPATKHDLSSLQVLQVGGAKFPREVARRVRATLGATLQQVFGMAEGLVNYTRLDDPDDVIVGTQGRPISPDDEVRIVDDDDAPVQPGAPGHLLTRGPYTIRGYHNADEANARAFTPEGFYRTGDIVRQMPGGYLEVLGRGNDMINRGGEKISPDEVEDQLLAHPQVHDVAMVSLPDAYLGERTCAVIIARGAAPRAAELKSWIRSRGLAAFKVPDQILFVDAFPATAAGKVSRKDLRAALREQLTGTTA